MPYSVYVIGLRPEVLGKKRVADEHSDRREDKPCVYVGQTARTPEDRCSQHLAGKHSRRIGREFGVKLKPRLYRNVKPFATRPEAEAEEMRLGEKLRRRGYAVWSR